MDRLFSLDRRLLMCASLVQNRARLIDVGTDHAYLPVYLLKRGLIESAVASDINEGPLEAGKADAEKYSAGNIEFRLGSGLSVVSPEDRITDAVIAGMGGDIIGQIILDSPLTRDKNLNLVLQPMTRAPELISLLYENGFAVKKQLCAESHGKVYTALSAGFTGEKRTLSGTEAYTGKLDLSENDSRLFLKKHIRNLKNKGKGDKSCLTLADELENNA
jgi:tRNA (adenine22-N1)-methyltransferase